MVVTCWKYGKEKKDTVVIHLKYFLRNIVFITYFPLTISGCVWKVPDFDSMDCLKAYASHLSDCRLSQVMMIA